MSFTAIGDTKRGPHVTAVTVSDAWSSTQTPLPLQVHAAEKTLATSTHSLHGSRTEGKVFAWLPRQRAQVLHWAHPSPSLGPQGPSPAQRTHCSSVTAIGIAGGKRAHLHIRILKTKVIVLFNSLLQTLWSFFLFSKILAKPGTNTAYSTEIIHLFSQT